jgi:Coenzyme PQQ synthesis protein D (PqqD)
MTRLTLRTDDLHWREVDDEIVALEGRGSTYLAANSSGGLLWRMLARGATRDELAAALVDAYGIDVGAAAADADRFVEQVRAAGLLAA